MEREELIRTVTAAQNGDSEALNTLFNAFYNDVYYFALKTVKDDDLACDITQETFVEIINTLEKLEEPVAFVSWMKKITYHQCTRYFKKKKDVLVDEDEDGNTVFDTLTEERAEFIPDEALDKEDFRQTIMSMIDKLSDEQRAAVMMYYFDELTVKQIAEIQDVSEGTVKSRLSYARKSIKGSVEEYEKKNNIKLHSFAFLPLLLWLFRGYFAETMSTASAQTVAAGVSSATGAAISVSAGTGAAAAVTATATATGIGAKIASIPVVAKVVAGVAAAAIVVGGGLAIANIATPDGTSDGTTTQPPQTTLSTEYEDNSQATDSETISSVIAQNITIWDDESFVTSAFANSVYEGMRSFSSVDELTADEAARLLYGFLRSQSADDGKRYEGIRTAGFNELCLYVLGKTYDVTALTGEYAYYDVELDAVMMPDTMSWNDALRAYSEQAMTDNGLQYLVVLGSTDPNVVADANEFCVTIFTQKTDGVWKLHSIQYGDYRLGGMSSADPQPAETQPTETTPEHTHNYSSKVTKEPTCAIEGTKTYSCSCGATYTETIKATGHTYTEKITADSTGKDEGTKTYTCTCGDTYTETFKLSTIFKSFIDNLNDEKNNSTPDYEYGTGEGFLMVYEYLGFTTTDGIHFTINYQEAYYDTEDTPFQVTPCTMFAELFDNNFFVKD